MAFLDGPVLYWGMRKVEWVQLIGILVGAAVGATVAYKRSKARRKKTEN
jgi:hypothetical protein